MNSHSFQLLLVYGIGIIVFLRYTARTLTRYSGAKVQVAPGTKFEVAPDKAYEFHNPREIRFAPDKSYEVANKRSFRYIRTILRLRVYLIAGGILLIWSLRYLTVAPLIRIMSKSILL